MTALPSAAADLHAIAQAVDQHYNRLRTLQAEFIETYRGAGADRQESGTLWLKKPGKMRWEYRSPEVKLFVSDGKDAWFYLPREKQARNTPVRKLDDLRSPIAFLLGKTKLEKELRGLSVAADQLPVTAGNTVLRGVPKALDPGVSEVLIEVTPENQISRLAIEQTDGSETEFRFTDQREDISVADDRFRFTPPAGVETITGELGQ